MDKTNHVEEQAFIQTEKQTQKATACDTGGIKNIWSNILVYVRRGVFQLKRLSQRIVKDCQEFYCTKSKCGQLTILSVVIVVVLCAVFLLVVGSVGTHKLHKQAINHTYAINSSKDSSIAAKMQVADSQAKMAQLMQKKLDTMQAELSKSFLSSQKLAELESQIHALSQSVNGMKASSDALKTAALKSEVLSQETQQAATQQVEKMRAQLSKITKAIVPQHYLPISDLPFQVAGIDFWNGKPMVSVAMKDMNGVTHYRLMGQGMSFDCSGGNRTDCSNWALSKLHTAPNEAIFMNQKGQKIKVKL